VDWKYYWNSFDNGQVLDEKATSLEAKQFVGNLTAAVPLQEHWRLLEFGCGTGHAAELLAPKVRELWVWDAAPRMLEQARRRVGGHRNVVLVRSADQLIRESAGAFDLVIVNSVVQYMSRLELTQWLPRWRDLIAEGGRLVISDLPQPGGRLSADVLSLLRFSLRAGVTINVVRSAFRNWLGYSRTRKSAGLLTLSREDVAALGGNVGFQVDFCPENLTYNKWRITAFLSRGVKTLWMPTLFEDMLDSLNAGRFLV
jgi:SAM-dependent methyltransferase